MIKKIPNHTAPLQIISPDHLRILGEIINALQSRSQGVAAVSQSIEHRLDVQVREYQRQIRLLTDASGRIREMEKLSATSRIEKCLKTQEELGGRLDTLLGRMAQDHRPQIGDVERKWFSELERLKARVKGHTGLASRAQVVCRSSHLYSLLSPS